MGTKEQVCRCSSCCARWFSVPGVGALSLARRWGGAGCLLSGTLRAESGREEKEVCEICFSLARKMFRGWQQFFAGSLNCPLLSLTCTVCTGGLGQFRIPDFSEGTACREADTAQPEAIVQLSVVPSAQKLMSSPLQHSSASKTILPSRGEDLVLCVCKKRHSSPTCSLGKEK